MQMRSMSSVFIQNPLTRTTDSNLKQEMTSARESSSIGSGASNNTNVNPAKSARPLMGRKSRVAVDRRVKNMQRGERSAKS